MRSEFRAILIALAVCLGAGSAARAGDDGAAPLWEGIGSIVTPLIGLGGDPKDPIEYREHGKLVVPKSMDLPEPGGAPAASAGWPVNQEVLRKKIDKEKEKQRAEIANRDPAKLRSVQSFPNAPVTFRASDQPDGAVPDQSADKSGSSSILQSLNPLGWVGMGKSATSLGAEPDREWLTDPPKGYRAPVAPTPAATAKTSASGQASN